MSPRTSAYCGQVPILLLLRHGVSTANTAGVLAGWSADVALTETGQQQAAAVGARLEEQQLRPVLVATSPLQRCAETADAVVRALSVPPVIEQHEGLGECHYGAWTGRRLSDLVKEPLWPVIQRTPSQVTFPDGEHFRGESMTDMAARATTTVRQIDERVREQHGDNAVWLAVSHGDVVKAILAEALGTSLDDFQRIVVDPASLSVVTRRGEAPVVSRVNDRGGSLAGLVPPPEGVVGGGDGGSTRVEP